MLPDLILFALTIYAEARGEPHAGRVMVAEVIANRRETSQQPWRAVIKAPYQFSCWNGGVNEQDALDAMINEPGARDAWVDCMNIARGYIGGQTRPTSPATHYLNPAKGTPPWANSMETVAHVGNHIFLKA